MTEAELAALKVVAELLPSAARRTLLNVVANGSDRDRLELAAVSHAIARSGKVAATASSSRRASATARAATRPLRRMDPSFRRDASVSPQPIRHLRKTTSHDWSKRRYRNTRTRSASWPRDRKP